MIVQFTTVHPRFDTRIFVKQCRSLAGVWPGAVHLLVADGKGDEVRDGIIIQDVGTASWGRIGRALIGSWRMWRALRMLKPAVAHFHDPELIGVGLLLKLSGIRVVYDVHEDVPRQILSKYWIPPVVRNPVSWLMSALEWVAGHVFDSIVTATPKIRERFPDSRTVIVQNFPLLKELVGADAAPYTDRQPVFAYVGAVGVIRGIREMVDAVQKARQFHPVTLVVGGPFSPPQLEDEIRLMPGSEFVNYRGWVSRTEVATLLGNARAGLVVLHPVKNYPDAYPVKMFEYMAAGLPVIASDFPLWRKIVEGAGCGLLVDPMNPQAIADAMCWILEHPDAAAEMGRRGRKAVEEKYNWEVEEATLLSLYRRLGASGGGQA
jgi:glycosyltransferase involved in cell wall biosynthesis